MAVAIVESTRPVTGGVDTHLDSHVGAALDASGGVVGVESFPATRAGYASLASWLAGLGPVERVGVEGTGAYGAGLGRHLQPGCRGDRGGPSEPSAAPGPSQLRQP
jgi:hypothetical protein